MTTVFRRDMPAGTYIEGLDATLGCFCGLSFVDRLEVTQFDRRLNGRPTTLGAEIRKFFDQQRTLP
jgi:hypothetical protein